jgi:uncharacterized protein YyaL (SSP411 family)
MPTNRLATATSPYLLQHKDNPVAWWQWSPEALAEAQRSNRPILLSVGYAACHWCHVMAHESFEDQPTAAVMNELFVNIKVDREERPDVDHVYMSALHALGEQGGWPLTMFLTPVGEPFWGGTYFPKDARFGRPAFVTVLREVARVFREEKQSVGHNTQALRQALTDAQQPAGPASVGRADLDKLGAQLPRAFDPVNGGLGSAPKFPNPPILEFLWRYADRTGNPDARRAFLLTLERMARGGIYDHLGGGFARYSVDARWLVPHFEKMLYDNAQLLELYGLAARETGNAIFADAARGIVAWLAREMTTQEGAFAASLDADSEGVEGKFYVWGADEIREVLGTDDARLFAEHYDVTPDGNWEEHNILNRLDTPDPDTAIAPRLAVMRDKLLARRAGRVRPGLDDKVLADWNGLMISALVRAGCALQEPGWIAMAERAFRFIADTMSHGDRLGHSWRDGALLFPGFATDHAAMARAALALAEATGHQPYARLADAWLETLARDYADAATGILAMTTHAAADLVVRPKPTHDDAVPNANGLYAEALVRRAMATGDHQHARLADRTLEHLGAVARATPLAHTSILNALDLRLRGAAIVVTARGTPLATQALGTAYPTRVFAEMADLAPDHPAARVAAASGDVALVCAGERCSLPIADPAEIAQRVREMTRADA